MQATLLYFHDPMCSWCYAFQPVWCEIQRQLPKNVSVLRVLGGLAADDDLPMPGPLQRYIREHWQRIQEVVPGTQFNFDYWTKCIPRRSTYPACRAVIAASRQGQQCEEAMIHAIQNAYYRQARNPSDYSAHIELAKELDLDVEVFEQDLVSSETDSELMRQVQFTAQTGVGGFPGLLLQYDDIYHPIQHDYIDAGVVLKAVNALIKDN